MRIALLLLLFPACSIPSESGWSCSTDGGLCPDGTACVDGVCQAAADMALTTDLSVTLDLSESPDLAPTVFGPVPGCVGPGRAVGTAFACPGTFTAGGAGKLCAAGYSPLADGSKISDVDCRALPGFYAGSVLLSRYSAGMPNSGVCLALPGVGQVRQFAGCGRSRSTVVDLVSSCVGFRQAVDVVPDPAWDVTGNTIDTASNTSVADGVLCFK